VAVNVFDQAARYAAKLNAAGFLRWLFPSLDPALVFAGWLDTRTVPFPGEPDRTCDTVASFRHPADPSRFWAAVVEFQAVPAPDARERLLEYVVTLFRALKKGLPPGVELHVVAGLLNLTGPEQPGVLEMSLPEEDGVGLWHGVRLRTMGEEDASQTLAAVAGGQIARSLLPWVPLMRGGRESANIEEWKRLAEGEPDQRRRADYAGVAVVLAELSGVRNLWKQVLEGWNVMQSQQVLEWQAEAEMRTKRNVLLRLLQLRFKTEVPADLAATVQAMTDLDTLSRWFDLAATSDSLAEFLQAVEK
jgi:hypothetical protein